MFADVPSWAWSLGALFAFLLALQFAFEGLVYGTGAALVWLFSLGNIRTGERRSFASPPPKLQGGSVFYRENATWYIYQNVAGIVGLLFWLALLLAIFGFSMFGHAL